MQKVKKIGLQVKKKKVFFERPVIMGILNVTPDSFSGERVKSVQSVQSAQRAWQMVEEGAGIIDIGGESTAPRSKDVSEEEELRRVVPVVRQLKAQNLKFKADQFKIQNSKFKIDSKFEFRNSKLSDGFLLSIDTYKLAVAKEVIKLGADIINDVTALRQGGRALGELIAKSGVGLVLMYAKDDSPRTTLKVVEYGDVVSEIGEFLQKRIEFAVSCGIKKEQIIIDPGMGAFVSADPRPSLEILRRLKEFKRLGCPILIGASRKGFIGKLLGDLPSFASSRLVGRASEGRPVDQRLEGGLACALMAVENGADIIRTHDVAETARFFKMWNRLNNG